MVEQPDTTYIHGTAASERARLSLLNSLLNEACLRESRPQGCRHREGLRATG
jgi:hypothetical protein